MRQRGHGSTFLAQFLDGTPDTKRDISPGGVSAAPFRDRFAVLRQNLQFAKRRGLPVNIPQDYRDYSGISGLMPVNGSLHFYSIRVIGRDKVRADEEQDDVSSFKVGINLVLPLLAGDDLPIVPAFDEALSLKELEMSVQFVPKSLVTMRIAIEQLRTSSVTRRGRLAAMRADLYACQQILHVERHHGRARQMQP
jgi:hypothetical protein